MEKVMKRNKTLPIKYSMYNFEAILLFQYIIKHISTNFDAN